MSLYNLLILHSRSTSRSQSLWWAPCSTGCLETSGLSVYPGVKGGAQCQKDWSQLQVMVLHKIKTKMDSYKHPRLAQYETLDCSEWPSEPWSTSCWTSVEAAETWVLQKDLLKLRQLLQFAHKEWTKTSVDSRKFCWSQSNHWFSSADVWWILLLLLVLSVLIYLTDICGVTFL